MKKGWQKEVFLIVKTVTRYLRAFVRSLQGGQKFVLGLQG